MRKSVIAVLVVVIAAAIAYDQRAAIAVRIMARGAGMAMSNDYVAGLKDGLHVILCGAGGPLPDPRRSGPCVAVVAGRQLFVVDAGTNGLRNLVRMRLPVGAIEAVLLTHFHSDHIDGLGEMATIRWVNGNNSQPLNVIGPDGVHEVVEGFNRAYRQDAVYRNRHHGDAVAPPGGSGLTARPFRLPTEGVLETVYDHGDLSIKAFAVDHDPVKPAVGYLFNYRDRSVLVSGDTARSANLDHFAGGVDLLVHEALAPDLVMILHNAAKKTGNEGLAKITLDILDYHTTPVEAAETARDAGAGHLLYYHIVPPLVLPGMEAAWLAGVDEVFPDHTLGRDGTAISLPSGSREVEVSSRGL